MTRLGIDESQIDARGCHVYQSDDSVGDVRGVYVATDDCTIGDAHPARLVNARLLMESGGFELFLDQPSGAYDAWLSRRCC